MSTLQRRLAGCARRPRGAAVQANTFLAQLLAAIQSGVADAMQVAAYRLESCAIVAVLLVERSPLNAARARGDSPYP